MASSAGTAYLYSVNLSGAAGGNAFNRSGMLILTDTISAAGTRNGVNPVDIGLFSGDPRGFPSAGAVHAVTNTKLASLTGRTGSLVTSALDLAYVTVANSCITVKPDQTILLGLYDWNPNMFSASSSIFSSQIYYIQKGEISFCFSDGFRTVKGIETFYGTSYFSGYQPTVEYRGVFSGTFIGTKPF